MRIILAALIVLGIISCSTTKSFLISADEELDRLHNIMIGSYDSSLQAEKDTNYYDISLHMVPIWNDDMTSKWLYVEQAVTSMPDKPYRQRMYQLKLNSDNTISSYVYTLDEPSLYIGMWKTPSAFNDISKKILSIREGCEVIMTRKGNGYTGATRSKTCASTMRGASYANSIVTISKDQLSSWDQGFDKNDQQVWGAENGPYIFRRINK